MHGINTFAAETVGVLALVAIASAVLYVTDRTNRRRPAARIAPAPVARPVSPAIAARVASYWDHTTRALRAIADRDPLLHQLASTPEQINAHRAWAVRAYGFAMWERYTDGEQVSA